MKRIVIGLLFLHFTVTSFSSTITVKGLNYEIDSITYIAKVLGRQNYSSLVSIPATIHHKGKKYDVVEISYEAFKEDKNIYELRIGKNIQLIQYRAFYNCNNLKNIHFNDSLRYISYQAFEGTEWLNRQGTGVIYCGKVAYTYKEDGYNSSSVTIKPGTVSIAVGCFLNERNLKTIQLPESLIEISEEAFENSNIEKIIIPKNVLKVSDLAFAFCKNLKEIDFQGCEHIGMSVFHGCNSLHTLSLSNNLEIIENFAFYECSSLKTVDIPSNVIKLGGAAFEKCTSLERIILHNGLKEIGQDVFLGCSKMEKITIPKTVEMIGSHFSNPCTLKTIFIEAEIPPVIVLPTGSEKIYTEEQIFTKIIKRFWSCSEERTLYVPTGCNKKYNSAEGWNLMTIKEM